MTPYPQGAWKCSKWPFWGHFARWFWAVFKTWFSYRALSPDRGQLRIVTLSILEIRCATVEKTDKRCVTVEKTQKSFETAEKTDKSCVTLEKTHPWKRTWSPKAVSSQSWILESIKKLREVESIFFQLFLSPWGLNCVAFEKRTKGALRLKKCRKVSRRLKKLIKGAWLSKKRTPESAPGRPKPFRAKAEYSNQLKSYEKSKAFFFSFSCPPGV